MVLRLPNQVRNAILSIKGIRHELYLRTLPPIEQALSTINLDAPWAIVWDKLSDLVLAGLEFSDELLSRSRPEPVLAEDVLKALHDDVSELIKTFSEVEIDPEVKQFVLRHLEAIEKAILEHRFAGTAPMQIAIEGVLGSLSLRPEMYDRVQSTPDGSRLWQVLGKIAVVISLAQGLEMIENRVQKLLPDYRAPAAQVESSTETRVTSPAAVR